MKRLKYVAITICLILMFTMFAACNNNTGGNNNNNNTDGNNNKTEYAITVEESSLCTITPSVTKATEGTRIELMVSNIAANTEIVDVMYNDKQCEKVTANKYTFSMPAENVKVKAATRTLEAVKKDGIAIFDESNLTTVAKNGTFNAPSIIDENMWCFDITFDTQHMTILKSEITSSNTEIVPDEAIEVREITSYTSNVIIGAKVIIDTTKINVGTTWLTMHFKNGNISGATNEGTLLIPVTVVEYGELILPSMNETVVLDLTRIRPEEGQQFTVRIGDYDYVDGSNGMQFKDYILTPENDKLTINFDYTEGHNYWIRISYGAEDDYKTTLTILEGSTSGGELKGGYLTFDKANATLRLIVEEK